DRRQHAHVVSRGAVHTLGAALEATKDVAPAYDQAERHPERVHLREFRAHAAQGDRVDSEPSHAATKRLARKLEKDSLVSERGSVVHVRSPPHEKKPRPLSARGLAKSMGRGPDAPNSLFQLP